MSDDEFKSEWAELHAWVDGHLPSDRVEAVLAHLRSHPADAVRVAEWQAQRLALRRLHGGMEPGPLPPAMARAALAPEGVRLGWRSWPRMAAAVLLLAAGTVLGILFGRGLHTQDQSLAQAPRGFAREAVIAHAIYTPETRHPVEVGAAEEAHLVAWLSRRLGSPLRVPQLQEQGFRLLGGRLLPGESANPRAQFMYEDARGRRLTLYVTTFGDGDPGRPKEISFRSFSEGPVEAFYWIEGSFGYALTAQLPAAEVMALARVVYRQLSQP